MNATPEVTKERLYEEFNTVVAETEQLLKSVATAGGDKAGALKAGFEQRLAAASERLAGIRANAQEQAACAARATDAYVKENPWISVGTAAAVGGLAGLVAGLLIARR
jgi:ElaB/YqjD/DUF883 family membrane-anchored ribosome-binding protein